VGDPGGFLRAGRAPAPKRPVEERVRDYRHVYHAPSRETLSVQASRCMDCGVPFCAAGCPLGNLIPEWNGLAHREEWKAAFERLSVTNNFPEFTGLLCPAPCEASCVLALSDEAVTIKEIELSIVERAFAEGRIAPRPPSFRTGRRVAVVGSGPAGLAAAQQLNQRGHAVVVFEKDDRLGGLLRYGIPDFKLEKWVIDRRIRLLRDEGIEFRVNTHVGVNPTLECLRHEFDAILLAVGALQGRDLSVPGRELDGIHLAMDYLTQQNRRVAGLPVDPAREISAAGNRVVIVGGGDTSADCLGNAHREGAASVHIVTHGAMPPERPGPHTWPDWPAILRTYPAHEEGGVRLWDLSVAEIEGDGCVERVRLSGRYGDAVTLDADLVLLAVGFDGPVRDRLLLDLGLDTARGDVAADRHYRTQHPGIYVAGDARRGASLIVWAIAEGRAAARSIDAALASQLTN
jgi:glutamate synthase (NADPH/NADH) small chain